MSDARAKAEARRAKILARESSMKVQAIGDDVWIYFYTLSWLHINKISTIYVS